MLIDLKKYKTMFLKYDKQFESLYSTFSKEYLPHAIAIEYENCDEIYQYVKKIIAGIFCESKEEKPCGECGSCVKILKNLHPDIRLISSEKDSESIKVEQIRDIFKEVFISSMEGKYKFYIINPAQNMTIQAQNALIKILEEPPKDVVFILICKSIDLILKTVLSRCQIFSYHINDISDSDFLEKCKKIISLEKTNSKIEIFKILSSIELNREVLKDFIYCLINCMIKEIKDNNCSNLDSYIKKIDSLKYAIDILSKNVNLNLVLTYISGLF